MVGLVTSSEEDWKQFRRTAKTTNHWDRQGWRPGRSAFYWYLTFENSDELHSMVGLCQRIVEHDPSFDLIPVDDVHMTLDRIAFEDEISDDALNSVERCVQGNIRHVPSFAMRVGPLSGSPGALSFSAAPYEQINKLRLTLTNLTASVIDTVAPASNFRPHVGIAYCNSPVPAQPIVAAVSTVRGVSAVTVPISHVSLVRLTRLERAYRWSVRRRFALGGDGAEARSEISGEADL